MTDDTACFTLSPIMKIEDCEQFYAFLNGARDKCIEIDCSEVERLGGMTAQLLAMASITWPKNALQVSFTKASQGFEDGLELLGLSEVVQNTQVAA